jgi:hypothetical protein
MTLEIDEVWNSTRFKEKQIYRQTIHNANQINRGGAINGCNS